MNTIFLTIFCSVLLLHKSQQQTDAAFEAYFEKTLNECEKETGAPAKDAIKIFTDQNYLPNYTMKCFFKCFNNKMGVMDATGNVIEEGLKKISPHFANANVDKKIDETCKNLKPTTDLCETAYTLIKCIGNAERS